MMAHVLHLDASPRGERWRSLSGRESHSRRITRAFVEQWKQAHPSDFVTYRDIGRTPVPHVTEAWIAAAFTPVEQCTPEMHDALAISDELVDEFLAADVYVMGIPMYNWTVSSGFKAYIDNIVRINRTWAYIPDENPEFPYKPLVHGKKMFVISARGDGGFAPGGRNAQRDFLTPYVKEAFAMLGVTDITFVNLENDEYGGQKLADSIAAARAQVTQLIAA